MKNGKYVLLTVNMVENFFDKVGRNTDYIFGAEEILADNFTLLLMGVKDVKSPEIIEKMRSLIK